MAESHHSKSSGGIFAKAQKRLNRTKAKMLQNLGKATRTTDQIFDEYVSNFNKQQAILTKLHKDLRNYTQSVKALCHASKILCDTMLEVYEDGWTDQLVFQQTVESFELLWGDYTLSLNERVQDPIQKHLNKFPELRGKINKRGRKLVDLDNSRHVLENLNNQKKTDEAKISKAQEELTESQRVFDEINENLHTDLPEFYDDRIRFYSTTFQKLFVSESVFHSEMGKLSTNLIDVCERLSANHVPLERRRTIQNNHIDFDDENSPTRFDESSPGGGSLRKSESDIYQNVTVSAQEIHNANDTYSQPSPRSRIAISSPENSATANGMETTENKEEGEKEEEDSQEGFEDENLYQDPPSNQPIKKSPDGVLLSETHNGNDTFPLPSPRPRIAIGSPENSAAANDMETTENAEEGEEEESEEKEEEDSQAGFEDENLYQVPPSNQPIKKPPDGALYSVQTTHPYTQGDSDELTFDAREIIYVIEPESPEEMDEGWLMGIKQSDGVKGVFPENFTVRLSG